MDETDLHLCPDVETKGLHIVGQQTILRAPGIDQVTYLFGSVDPFKGVEGLLLGKRSSESPASFERWLQRRKQR